MDLKPRPPRQRVLKGAKIILNKGTSIIDCTVRNVSSAGALLMVPSTVGIPSMFELLIAGEGRPRPTEVIWRQEDRLGVQFLREI